METIINPKNKYQRIVIDKKTCICCGKTKSSASFYDHHSSIDGKANECKKCKITIDKEYYKTKKKEKTIMLRKEISRPYTDKEQEMINDFLAKRGSK